MGPEEDVEISSGCLCDSVLLLQRRTRERLMNVLSLCGPESGVPKNPSVRLLSYSKASDKVSVKSLQDTPPLPSRVTF